MPKGSNSFSETASQRTAGATKDRTYQQTNDPYIVKDDYAEVKHIGYEDIVECNS